MATKTIYSRAPTRIDLAGGTVDIWPIYLFLQNPITLNLAIDLFAEATLELSARPEPHEKDAPIVLRSDDQNIEECISWRMLEEGYNPPPSLELHYKLLKFFFEKRKATSVAPPSGTLKLSTRALSPAGAGLGGSSALSVAITGALAVWANLAIDPKTNGDRFIEIVRDIETTVIKVPAGLQDYYGSMYGGLQSIHWGPSSHMRHAHPSEGIAELEKRLLLFYSGQSRNSGINNWALFKGFIDREDGVQAKFAKIVTATQNLDLAIKAGNWEEVGRSIEEEWEVRKTLASGITTPEIDQAFAEAKKLAPITGKVCGAGGGGCFFIYLPTQSGKASPSESLDVLRTEIRKIFERHGMRYLPFQGVSHGLDVTLHLT